MMLLRVGEVKISKPTSHYQSWNHYLTITSINAWTVRIFRFYGFVSERFVTTNYHIETWTPENICCELKMKSSDLLKLKLRYLLYSKASQNYHYGSNTIIEKLNIFKKRNDSTLENLNSLNFSRRHLNAWHGNINKY